MNALEQAADVMRQQLGHDVIIALATCADTGVNVRNVDGYYKDGCVYVVTHEGSHKMQEIMKKSEVAFCKDLLCARGVGKNLGSPKEPRNRVLRDELRAVFSAFYDRHVDEDDPKTCILQIRLTWAVAFTQDTKYTIDYAEGTVVTQSFVNDIIMP